MSKTVFAKRELAKEEDLFVYNKPTRCLTRLSYRVDRRWRRFDYSSVCSCRTCWTLSRRRHYSHPHLYYIYTGSLERRTERVERQLAIMKFLQMQSWRRRSTDRVNFPANWTPLSDSPLIIQPFRIRYPPEFLRSISGDLFYRALTNFVLNPLAH